MTRSNPTLVWPGGKFSTKWLVLKLPTGHQGFSAKEQSGGPSLEAYGLIVKRPTMMCVLIGCPDSIVACARITRRRQSRG